MRVVQAVDPDRLTFVFDALEPAAPLCFGHAAFDVRWRDAFQHPTQLARRANGEPDILPLKVARERSFVLLIHDDEAISEFSRPPPQRLDHDTIAIRGQGDRAAVAHSRLFGAELPQTGAEELSVTQADGREQRREWRHDMGAVEPPAHPNLEYH